MTPTIYNIIVVCIFSIFELGNGIPLSNNKFRRVEELSRDNNNGGLQLWLTISAQKRFLEVSWINAPAESNDMILITKQEPEAFIEYSFEQYTPLANFDETEGSALIPIHGYTTPRNRENWLQKEENSERINSSQRQHNTSVHKYWKSRNGDKDIVAAIKPSFASDWFTTGVPFDYNLSRNVTGNTDCYGYWVSYININGDILATSCIRAYPRWMNKMSLKIENLRFIDLFIPGTHDSGSVKPNFDPMLKETLITKYALTQDENIKGQLMHGARYLDLRIGYYKRLPYKFYINHGVTRHRPLNEVLNQIKDFVKETNEILIVGFKEFPVGFGKNLDVHRLLVQYLSEELGNLIVDPSVTWSATLQNIWTRKQNVILAYDEKRVVREFPHFLFESVQQRWGNVQTWSQLEKYLREVNERDISRYSSRPVSDMAELTPDTWDVIKDTMGGLRKMADNVNWRISKLYRDELAEKANIVALDFIRGTNLVDLAITINENKSRF